MCKMEVCNLRKQHLCPNLRTAQISVDVSAGWYIQIERQKEVQVLIVRLIFLIWH